MSKSISRFRTAAFLQQNGLCYYCKLPMWLTDPAFFVVRFGITPPQAAILQCTAEHLNPRSEGGQDCALNIVAACRYCNTRRHWKRKTARTPEDHRKHVQRRIQRRRWHGLVVPPYRCRDFASCVSAHSSASENLMRLPLTD